MLDSPQGVEALLSSPERQSVAVVRRASKRHRGPQGIESLPWSIERQSVTVVLMAVVTLGEALLCSLERQSVTVVPRAAERSAPGHRSVTVFTGASERYLGPRAAERHSGPQRVDTLLCSLERRSVTVVPRAAERYCSSQRGWACLCCWWHGAGMRRDGLTCMASGGGPTA